MAEKSEMVKVLLPSSRETLWASPVGPSEYRLENVPFYAEGLHWGDRVRVERDDGRLVAAEVVAPGGHRTVRVVFDPRLSPSAEEAVLEALNEVGATYERARVTVALDIPPEADVEAVEQQLHDAEQRGLLRAEGSGSSGFLRFCERADGTGNFVAVHEMHPPPATVLFADVRDNPVSDYLWEELQVAPTAGGHEVLSVPFFTKGLARGDVVTAAPAQPEFVPEVTGIARSSGRYALRVMAADASARELVRELADRLGAGIEEQEGGRIIALDAPDADITHDLREELDAAEDAGRLMYDTGWA